MPRPRLPMRKIRDVLRLSAAGMSKRSIEQAIRESGVVAGSLDDAGYRAVYAVAEDNLCLGRVAIGDPVNPWMLTRNAWRDTGLRVGARIVEIETVCSDVEEHRHRVDTRAKEVPGLILPDWQAVIGTIIRGIAIT
jgi:hypothetical protein